MSANSVSHSEDTYHWYAARDDKHGVRAAFTMNGDDPKAQPDYLADDMPEYNSRTRTWYVKIDGLDCHFPTFDAALWWMQWLGTPLPAPANEPEDEAARISLAFALINEMAGW